MKCVFPCKLYSAESLFRKEEKGSVIMIVDKIALILTIIGALNWGSIGLFSFDIVAWIFGGQAALVSRIIYTLVGLAGIWCISLLFRTDTETNSISDRD